MICGNKTFKNEDLKIEIEVQILAELQTRDIYCFIGQRYTNTRGHEFSLCLG
jgi:hypothetical protein